METKLNNNRDTFKFIFVCTFICGLCAHAFRYFNTSFSHSSMMVHQDDIKWQISLGRFIQPLYTKIRGDLCAPFLIGLFSLIFLAMGIFIITKIFELKSKVSVFIICGFLATNTVLAMGYASFIDWVDIYMLSFLLNIVCVYILNKYKYGFIFSIIPLMFALGLYQVYIETSIVLFILIIIKKLIENEEVKKVVILGFKMLFTLLASLVIYYVVLKIILNLSGVSLSNEYNGISGVGDYSNNSIASLILRTFMYAIKSFCVINTYKSNLVFVIFMLLLTFTIYSLVKICKKNCIRTANKVLLAIAIFLIPFGVNAVYFISKGIVHELMTFSFSLVIILTAIVYEKNYYSDMDKQENNYIKYINAFGIAVISIVMASNIIYSNQLYLKKSLEYETSMTVMTRIIDRIERTDDYEIGKTKVALVGDFGKSQIAKKRKEYNHLIGTSVYGIYSMTYFDSYRWMLEDVLSYPINLASEEESTDYSKLDEVKNMKNFPDKDCCKMINGVLVVKIADKLPE